MAADGALLVRGGIILPLPPKLLLEVELRRLLRLVFGIVGTRRRLLPLPCPKLSFGSKLLGARFPHILERWLAARFFR